MPAVTACIGPAERRREVPTVAVVGGAAAGSLAALHLLREATERRTRVDVVVLEPASEVARGVAYSTTDSRHLLNVPASGMSALPNRPGDFIDYRCRFGDAPDPSAFAPRAEYGEYLRTRLAAAAAAGPGRLRRLRTRAEDLRRLDHGVLLTGTDGTQVRADAVVLATGLRPPGVAWAPRPLRRSARFVADPWAAGALVPVPDDVDVLLVGTGLTMVDVALTLDRPGRALHAVSRRGRLPAVHDGRPREALAPSPELMAAATRKLPVDADMVRRLLAEALSAAVTDRRDWRAAFDTLRPFTQQVWSSLDDAARADLARDAAWWDLHRHRMPAQSAGSLARMRAAGRLHVGSDEVVAARDLADGVLVSLASGRALRVGAVVNCTGPEGDVRRERDTLVADLLATGRAVPGPLGLGLRTRGGRVVDALGTTRVPLFTLGALRRGELWESTSVPEIRGQAARLAGDVLDAVTARVTRAHRRTGDCMGEALTTTRAAAAAFDRGLHAVMRVQSGAAAAFAQAVDLDPGFAMGHAALAMLGHETGEDVDVAASLAAARAALVGVTERERSFVAVVEQRVRDCRGAGARALLRHLQEHPRDVLAVSAAVPTIAFSGVTDVQRESWDLVEGLTAPYAGHWFHHSLLAFVRQDQMRYGEAAALADQVLAHEPASGHAVHARTHVFYETGRHTEGVAWLDEWIDGYGRRAKNRVHYSWHAALHQLHDGDVDGLRRRWLAQLAPPAVNGVRALVDSACLLWRNAVTCAGADLAGAAEVLRHVEDELVDRPGGPFAAMHAAVAPAAAADVARLRRLRAFAAGCTCTVMRHVVVPLCDGLEAVVEARWEQAVTVLRPLLPRLAPVGGSLAQREVVEDTFVFALVGAGRCSEAAAVLDARLDRRPSGLDDRRRAAVAARHPVAVG